MNNKIILELNGEPVYVIDGSEIEIICERPNDADDFISANKSISLNLKASDDSLKWLKKEINDFKKKALAFKKVFMRYNRMMTKKHPIKGREIVKIIKKKK